jgi:hypothetical protein
VLAFLWIAFGYVFYLPGNAIPWFLLSTFFLGLGGANFAVYSFWLPERLCCRVSAFAFNTNAGRFAGACLTFLVGATIRQHWTLGTPVALTSIGLVGGACAAPFRLRDARQAPAELIGRRGFLILHLQLIDDLPDIRDRRGHVLRLHAAVLARNLTV